MEADDADVLLSGALLRLDEAGGAVDADNQAARDLGVEGTAVARLFNAVLEEERVSECRESGGEQPGTRTGGCA